MARTFYPVKIMSFDSDIELEFLREQGDSIHARWEIGPGRELIVSSPSEAGSVSVRVRRQGRCLSLSLTTSPEREPAVVDLYCSTEIQFVVMRCLRDRSKEVFVWIGRQQFGFTNSSPRSDILNVPLHRALEVGEALGIDVRKESIAKLRESATSISHEVKSGRKQIVVAESFGNWLAWFDDTPQVSFAGDSPVVAADRLWSAYIESLKCDT
jgi:hypothetical protein